MATIKEPVGSRQSITFSGLSSLAAGTYVESSSAYVFNTNQPINAVIEVNAGVSSAPTANRPQVAIFLRISMDGTNHSTGPTSCTSATRDPN